jgi:hypothetical protein
MSNAIAALTATMQAREDYERRKAPNSPDMLPVSASPFGRSPYRINADLKVPKFGTGCVLMIALGASLTE